MIIELFGPPGVGKTTFAGALAERLRERGRIVELISSHRETRSSQFDDSGASASPRLKAPGPVRRLARPAVEMVAVAGDLSTQPRDAAIASELVRILPPSGILWSLRLRQYLLRLLRLWRRASQASHIVLFDQGCVQAVCSLAVLGRATDRNRIAQALASLPTSDLLIGLTAPRIILEDRLQRRFRSPVERLFGISLDLNLRFVAIFEEMDDLLRSRAKHTAKVDCLDKRTLADAIEQIDSEVAIVFEESELKRAHQAYAPDLYGNDDDIPR